MTQAQKPHSTLDEARTLIADYEDLGTVERIRHGDEYTHDAVELLKSLIEQLEVAEANRAWALTLAYSFKNCMLRNGDTCNETFADLITALGASNPASGSDS